MEGKPEAKERELLISEEIDSGTVSTVVQKILEINADDNKKDAVYRDWERKPIMLYINSFGGSVYDGLALVDMIKRSKTPVYTVCIGSCMSMGLWIFLAGAKRIVGENATLMFHDIFTLTLGKSETIKQDLNETLRLQTMLVDAVLERSLVKRETLQDYITRKAEWYIPAAEAINLRLADEYYK